MPRPLDMDLDGGLVHDAVVDPLQPVVVPAEHGVVLVHPGAGLHRRIGSDFQLLGAVQDIEQLDRAIDRPAAALVDLQIDRDVDVAGQVDGVLFLVPRAVDFVRDDVEPAFVVDRIVQDVDEVRPGRHVGIGQAFRDALPDLLLGTGLQHPRLVPVGEGPAGIAATTLARRARHEPHDAAVIGRLVEVEVTAADEDRLEAGRTLGRGKDLHRAEIRDPDHADGAVAPGLRGHPFDEVVGVLSQRHATGIVIADMLAFRSARSAHVADHVDIAFLDHTRDVARLDAAVPQRRGTLLRRNGQRERLKFLAIGAERNQGGAGFVTGGVIGVGRKMDAVAHGHAQVFEDLHQDR